MNILQINTTDTRGGAAKVAYSLKKELEKRGHQSPMLVGRKYSTDPDVLVFSDMLSFGGRVRRKLAYWLANDIDVFSSDHILNTEEFKKADIVHCHNLHSNYFKLSTLTKMSKLKPIVWTFHDMWPLTAHCAHSFHGGLKNGFFQCPALEIYPPIAWHNEKYLEKRKRNIYDRAKFSIVTPSRWLADKVGESLLNTKPISLIYNGIDTTIFRPYKKDAVRQELGLPENKKIILSVIKRGQSNPWKGADYFSEIVEQYKNNPDVLFISLGGDSDSKEETLLNVPYTKNQTELAKYYSASDILLYPSIADNCPLVVLEAMACGLPVVTFKTGGIPELVEHKVTGYVAEYKKLKDLQTGIAYILNLKEDELATMRSGANSRVAKQFTTEKMAEQYLSLYQSLV